MSSTVSWFLFLLQENLQIYLKSTQGPIEVYLCPEEVQEPDSPAKEALPSTSVLSPVADGAEPSCSTDPGITETTASSGRPSVPSLRLMLCGPASPGLLVLLWAA